MRGKLSSDKPILSATEITPADAGKTKTPTLAVLLARDHPRGCGENSNGRRFSNSIAGSPPRMRGKPGVLLPAWAFVGITPADAGKTL